MERDGSLRHLALLLGDAQVDAALFSLKTAHDFGFGGFQPGTLDGILRVEKIAVILLGGDARLGHGLIERGLGLAQLRLLLLELLLSAGGVEADDGVAGLDQFTGRGEPGDAQIGNDGGDDLYRAGRPQLAAAADDDEEIALTCGSDGQRGASLHMAEMVDSHAGATERQEHARGRRPKPDAPATRAHLPPPDTEEPGAGASTTTAAERSGMRCGSTFSSLKTAANALMGLPKAEEATGLTNSKCAGNERSG